MTESLQEIIQKLWIARKNAEWTPRTDTLELADIRHWSKSDDVEILGFTSAMIHDARFRINPPLMPDEYRAFVMHYYERCLKEDPKGKWADSRYSAGAALVNIFASLWRDSYVPREVVKELKDWFSRLYVEGDESVRACLVTSTLEHLFEQKDIRDFFADWRTHPVLGIAHREASQWYLEGGKTALGRPQSEPPRRKR
jgi:hypothetical protein